MKDFLNELENKDFGVGKNHSRNEEIISWTNDNKIPLRFPLFCF